MPPRNYQLEFLSLSGFRRGRILSNVTLPLKILASVMQSFRVLNRFKPQVALGTGGYVCGPILLCAAMCRVPILLQEQNSFPGVTTRLLARFAREIFLNFEEASKYLPSRCKWRQLGNPVRPEFKLMDKQAAVKKLGLNGSLPTLLVFGGSQGAMSLNRAVHESLSEFGKVCNLIWSRGYLDKREMQGWAGPGKLMVKPFIEEMPLAYAASDLAVCRSGAMTLSELQAAALPAILVPYPHAAGDHQRHNAGAYAGRGGAVVIEDRELDGKRLLREIKAFFQDRDQLDNMQRALADIRPQDAAGIIAEEVLKIGEERMKSSANRRGN